jgi:hypothetical protein
VTVSTSKTKMRRCWLVLGSVILVSLGVAHWGCEVPPLMAPGSSISLIANPDFIVANGGVSVITAIVTEPAGTFVPDGSVVFFFTNLGRIDPQGKTVNGVARVNLVADSRSGEATVTAFASGGAAPASGGGGGSTGTTTVPVRIGSVLPANVIVTANPPSVVAGGRVTITANVFDASGNPVANVPVIFTLGTQGPPAPGERMESGGAPRFTDTNGQAFDTLITRPSTSGRGNRTLQVQANVAGLDSPGTVPVLVTQ